MLLDVTESGKSCEVPIYLITAPGIDTLGDFKLEYQKFIHATDAR